MKQIFKLPSRFLGALIWLYQKTLSFDHGPLKVFYPYGYCRFYPTCSEYGRQAVLKHGALKGSLMAFRRIANCHPWSEPQVDLVS